MKNYGCLHKNLTKAGLYHTYKEDRFYFNTSNDVSGTTFLLQLRLAHIFIVGKADKSEVQNSFSNST
jgi:hypothetical protein